MTFFIWFITLFIDSLITISFVKSGIRLGALFTVLLYGCSFFFAKKICKYYKSHKNISKSKPNFQDETHSDINKPTTLLKQHSSFNFNKMNFSIKRLWGIIPSIALVITIILLINSSHKIGSSNASSDAYNTLCNNYDILYNNYIYLSEEYHYMSNTINSANADSLSQLKSNRLSEKHSDDIMVYIFNDSLKYHRKSNCENTPSDHINLSQAISSGYDPCEKCYPLPSK